jgi:two-component system, cell cycle sensor histidine kinase and response regulator CckA
MCVCLSRATVSFEKADNTVCIFPAGARARVYRDPPVRLHEMNNPMDQSKVPLIQTLPLRRYVVALGALWTLLFAALLWIDIPSALGYGLLWILGLTGLWLGSRKVNQQITRSQEAREALINSERHYRSLIQGIRVGVVVCTPTGRLITCNRIAQELFNLPEIDAAGGSLVSMCPLLQEDGTAMPAEEHPVALVAATKTAVRDWVARLPGLDKLDKRWVLVNADPDFDARGEVSQIIITFVDITEHKRIKEHLLQVQKMEAVGRLAGGVAHDFNNLLTGILGYADLGLNRVEAEHPVFKILEEIRKAGEQAASLTSQLLAFGRRQRLESRVVDLNFVVAESHIILQRVIGEHITLSIDLSPEAGWVKADPVQIQQSIMNLAVNARDAMPKGGQLTIRTENRIFEKPFRHEEFTVASGAYAVLSVTDTGCGIDKRLQANVFEPFFTTKTLGKGTGLGLATVYGIVKQSGGYIWIESEPDHGSTFTICLPLVQETPNGMGSTDKALAPSAGNEIILLVEDADYVRKLLHTYLVEAGYRVIEASNGLEALRAVDQGKRAIDMLLTDIVMPHMTGVELSNRLKPVYKNLKVLFISGYSDHEVVDASSLQEADFLQKPFTPAVLTARVRAALHKA